KTNGDCLFRRPGAVFAMADLVYLLAHKFSRLSRRRLAGPLCALRFLDCLFLGHNRSPSALTPLKAPPLQNTEYKRAFAQMAPDENIVAQGKVRLQRRQAGAGQR